jgi:uncharacterized membrane protein SirB2
MEIQLSTVTRPGKFILKLAKDFFTPYEFWGRQNRNQFFVGLGITAVYFVTNAIFHSIRAQAPFVNSSNGLLAAIFICLVLIIVRFFAGVLKISSSEYPWYEKYMPLIITLLGLTTLLAMQNLNGKGDDDAGMWINIVVLLVIFIIAAGHFVEGSTNERALKIWFALFGYYFSVVAFFYFLETWSY